MASHTMIIISLSLFSLLTFSHATCKSQTFSNKKINFQNCDDLPALGASLHWTHNPAQSTLSMAFTASPPANGWVAWALNPTGSGMIGAQSLIAFKPTPSGPISVNTYDIQSYHAIVKGPITFNVTDLSAEEASTSDGHVITIFATWTLPKGESSFNQVWQVGPVLGSGPAKHGFEQSNLSSKTKLRLAGGLVGGPTEAPGPISGGNVEAVTPSTKTSGAVYKTKCWVALVALVAYWI